MPKWYVLDRNKIQSYVEYGGDTERIGAIGEVFPVIFFLVAALVSLTTMTRMVEEQRTQIGILKALGYTGFDVAKKYGLVRPARHSRGKYHWCACGRDNPSQDHHRGVFYDVYGNRSGKTSV